jgi:hypothetical protein
MHFKNIFFVSFRRALEGILIKIEENSGKGGPS